MPSIHTHVHTYPSIYTCQVCIHSYKPKYIKVLHDQATTLRRSKGLDHDVCQDTADGRIKEGLSSNLGQWSVSDVCLSTKEATVSKEDLGVLSPLLMSLFKVLLPES